MTRVTFPIKSAAPCMKHCSVEGDRVATQHDEARTSSMKLDQEVAKLLEELDHARVRGTKRTATPWRECTAGSNRARLKLSTVRRVASEMAAAPLTGVKSISPRPS